MTAPRPDPQATGAQRTAPQAADPQTTDPQAASAQTTSGRGVGARMGLRPSVLARSAPAVVCSLLVLAVSGLALLGSETTQRTATQMLVMGVITVGTYIYVGNSGVLSFGHVVFVAVGAYTTALTTLPRGLKQALLPALPGWLAELELGLPAALLLSGLLSVLVAALFALLTLRLDGMAAGIASLALLISVNVVISNWDAVTRGSQGIVGIPADLTIGTAVPWLIGAIAVALTYQSSRSGFRLRASREDPVAAAALGIRIRRDRSVALVISAFVCGVGGGLYARFLGALTPGDVYLQLTLLTLLMLIVGGIRSLSGAVVGTLFISVLAELLRRIEAGGGVGPVEIHPHPGIQQLILALTLLLTLLLRPGGITSGRELGFAPPGWLGAHRKDPRPGPTVDDPAPHSDPPPRSDPALRPDPALRSEPVQCSDPATPRAERHDVPPPKQDHP
ncbi:branched-chain amino acid ABC transporter permease [Actinomadura decatromicini]|uniref:Branched-chain amino acid ABC transporter permease n=1 Tax=Actinomadura decatromicini TaxID=2604572 RepID=A0A5D3F1W9_9ACTN|nr:branched-chain amino acid ABC transporter permease [Actinomadura decatromicini]TYK43047.1 branched-chain amino acid ABC transporter permease [Actinomadura decatromicini]